MKLDSMTLWLVLDTETTGDDPTTNSIMELGWALCDWETTHFCGGSYIAPAHPCAPEARAAHQIWDEDVKGAPQLTDVLQTQLAPQLREHVDKLAAYVAHNAPFDSSFLPMLNKKPWLDTLRLAKKLFPGLPSYKNQALRYRFDLDHKDENLRLIGRHQLQAHRAESDAVVTAALLRYLLKQPKVQEFETTTALLAWVNEPFLIETCPFPKHKGKLWVNVAKLDRDYCLWLLKGKEGEKPLDDDMQFSIRHALKQVWG